MSCMPPSALYPEALTPEYWQSLKKKFWQENSLSTKAGKGHDSVCQVGAVVQPLDQLWAFALQSKSNTGHSGDSGVLLKLQRFHQLWVDKKCLLLKIIYTHYSAIISVGEKKKKRFCLAQLGTQCRYIRDGHFKFGSSIQIYRKAEV